jgi:hypothetical protein
MTTETKLAPEDLRISDETARMILERAIQLDAKRPGDTTLAELQRVAQDLNVSSGALMEAIRELQTKALTPAPKVAVAEAEPIAVSARASGPGWWRTLAITLGSFLFAVINRNDTPYDPTASMFLLFFGAIALIILHRRNRTPRQFQRDLLALCGGVVVSWVVSGGGDAEAVVYGSTFSWLFASTVGGWLTRWRRKPRQGGSEPTTETI